MSNIPNASVLDEVTNEANGRIYSAPAKRVLEKLAPMSSHIENYQRRWFWELLQNACDYNECARVELEITDDKLFFRHNGSPFYCYASREPDLTGFR